MIKKDQDIKRMGYPKNRISIEYYIEIIVNKKWESESIGYQKNRKPKKQDILRM